MESLEWKSYLARVSGLLQIQHFDGKHKGVVTVKIKSGELWQSFSQRWYTAVERKAAHRRIRQEWRGMIYPGGGNSRQVGVLGCNMQVQVSWQTVESLQPTKSEALSATTSSWKVWFNNMKAAQGLS